MNALDNLPKTLKIDVDYYNDTHKKLLGELPSSQQIQDIAEHTIEVSTLDLLTYYMFHQKDPGDSGLTTFEELSELAYVANGELSVHFDLQNESLRLNPGSTYRERSIAERIGEAIGMSVINKVHGLSRADWNKLVELRRKGVSDTFDYSHQIASDGEAIIHIETKGSLVSDNSKQSPISNHKASIESKKKNIRGDKSYPYSSDIMYGTIAAIDNSTDRNAKCWILDPTPDETNIDPLKLRLLNRFSFILGLIRMVSPRSQLTTALTTRFYDLAAISDYEALDGLPIRKPDGEPFPIYQDDYNVSPIFALNKSYLTNGHSLGKIVGFGGKDLIYFGVDMEAINIMAKQDFDSIIGYSIQPRQFTDTIRCYFSKSRALELETQISQYFPEGVISEHKDYLAFQNKKARISSFSPGLDMAFLAKG